MGEVIVRTLELSTLGPLVRERRGLRRLREVAEEIGISAATLMRIEGGRMPDVETFGKVCRWLGIDPGEFLGFDTGRRTGDSASDVPVQVSAHFRADRLPDPETAKALARMLLFIAKRATRGTLGDVDA